MKLYELMSVVSTDTKVVLCDDECNEITNSKEVIKTDYTNMEVESLWIDDGVLYIGVETPTWRITGTFTVSVDVTVTALTADDAWDKVERLDADDLLNGYGLGDDVELYDSEYGDIDWDEIEKY